MTKFLILHGTASSPDANWFMWLKDRLTIKGYTVWLPQLPNSDKPNTKTYTDFILNNKEFKIDSDTVLIGHSSGSVEILSLLGTLPRGVVVKAAILVSAFKDNLDWDILSGLFDVPLNFDSIKSHSKKIIFIHSDNDPYVPLEHAEFLSKELSGELVIMGGQGHFNTELNSDYKSFPELLDIIETIR